MPVGWADHWADPAGCRPCCRPCPADYIHPGGLGQKIMADLGALLIQETVLDLLLYPWSQQDQAMLNEPLPPPMYKGQHPAPPPLAHPSFASCWQLLVQCCCTPPPCPPPPAALPLPADNWETDNKLCLHNDDFKTAVTEAKGFEYVNEGTEAKPKWGYVSGGWSAGALPCGPACLRCLAGRWHCPGAPPGAVHPACQPRPTCQPFQTPTFPPARPPTRARGSTHPRTDLSLHHPSLAGRRWAGRLATASP